jgi:hypothetical protein
MTRKLFDRLVTAICLLFALAMFYGAAHDPWAFAQNGSNPTGGGGGGAATCGSAAGGVCFNSSGAFASDSGLVYAGSGGGLTETFAGSGGKVLLSLKATNVNGSGATAGLVYTAVDGQSTLAIQQGSSGGGVVFQDFNGQDLFGIGINSGGFPAVDFWSIQGTNNTALGDLGPGTDNTSNIGDATHRVKNIFAAAVTLNAQIAAGSPPTLTGSCTTASQTGGNTAGTFTATCVSQTVTITFATTAPAGWHCTANDWTTPADALKQTASSTTSCTLTGTTVAVDRISFGARGF